MGQEPIENKITSINQIQKVKVIFDVPAFSHIRDKPKLAYWIQCILKYIIKHTSDKVWNSSCLVWPFTERSNSHWKVKLTSLRYSSCANTILKGWWLVHRGDISVVGWCRGFCPVQSSYVQMCKWFGPVFKNDKCWLPVQSVETDGFRKPTVSITQVSWTEQTLVTKYLKPSTYIFSKPRLPYICRRC